MLIGNYIRNINQKYLRYFFSGISADSNKIKHGNIFFAIKGNLFDGNKFISNAIKNGARIIISENCKTEIKKNILYIKSNNVRKLFAEFAFKISDNKFKKLVAVTGTNGKSSIANFFYQILKLNKKKVATIGTLGIKSKKFNLELKNTTIDPLSLSKYLKILKKNKIDYIILEASSHGLKQNRLDGLLFDIGIFTNLSHDHLDYHKNLKNYLDAKLYLFKELIKKNGSVITDKEIPQFKKISEISTKNILKLNSISSNKSDLQLISHNFENENQNLIIKYKNKFYKFKLNLIGKIQVKNILMTILAAVKCGLKIKDIIKVMEKIRPIEGRLEKIGHIKNNSKIILDYAHTPGALLTTLNNLKEQFPKTPISIVFGCGGNRDKKKRAKMGKIVASHCDKIYLTDDNPRNENPNKIREDIKKGILKAKFEEISDRKSAINKAIKQLETGQILLVAGKGHEKTQEFGNKNIFFSDKEEILKSIKIKNNILSTNLKLNLIKDLSKNKINLRDFILKNICINSKELKKNDIFFAIKGKYNDGYDFIGEALKKKASLVVTHKINKRFNLQKQIKVKNTLSFLTLCSQLFRKNINSQIIAITGSCGKTTLKEFVGRTLKKFYKVYYSPKSFNNKYGVPLSLLNLNQNDKFGIFEIGMDKKGEIDQLSKIIQPDVGIITNINFAHAKNFKNLKGIAEAKGEIINNIKKNGTIILNADDKFFIFHKKLAITNNLNIISFAIKNKHANIKFLKISKLNKKYKLFIKIKNKRTFFYISNDNKNYILNLLALIALLNLYLNILKLNKNLFLDLESPKGRGDISKVKVFNKIINLIDESYNSNPLSLESAIQNFDKIKNNINSKHLILGDMLELGKYSKKLHQDVSTKIKNTSIDKVHIIGKDILFTYDKISKSKRGLILKNKIDIFNLIKNDLNNNDYLMIKGSNSTGLNTITNEIKRKRIGVI